MVMVSVASPSPNPMVRSEEDLGPPWLRPLLGTSFFVPCRLHPELSKNECNLFCLGCTGDALCAYCLPAHRDHHVVQEILDSVSPFVDGLKFSGGCHSLMGKELVREITDLAHKHDIYVSTGDWAEHLLRQGPSSFKQYVEECKALGFDTIELNAGSLNLPEEALLRLVRLIKSSGLRAKPMFSVKFDSSDIPASRDRAFAAYIAPVKEKTSERVEDVDLLIRRAERCLEAGADMIMIDADDVCQRAESLRTDIVAKIVGRLGLDKTMFEASNPNTSEWFVRQYGPRVNLFVDHSDVMNLERLRGFNMGRSNLASRFASPFFLM